MSVKIFRPEDLIPIKRLCEEKAIPLSHRRVRELCRLKQFPAVRLGKDWATTRDAVRSYFYRGANKAFRRMSV
jgi:hypothetical protein